MKRVVVTGSSGLLGRHVIDALAGGYAVEGFDRGAPVGAIPFTAGDILDRPALDRAFEGADAVIHLAAMPNLHSGAPDRIIEVNTLGVWNVLQAATEAGVRRVVLCSSDSATGLTLLPEHMAPPLYLPVDGAHPLRPTEAYGLSKTLGEEIGRSVAARGALEVIALRPVYVLYPGVIGEVVRRARDPDGYRPPVSPGAPRAGGGPFWHHVLPEDAARAFRLALDCRYRGFEAVFVSAPETLAPEPTLARIRRLFGHLPEVRRPDLYERNPFAPVFDIERTREVLGFAPGGSGRAVVERAVQTSTETTRP